MLFEKMCLKQTPQKNLFFFFFFQGYLSSIDRKLVTYISLDGVVMGTYEVESVQN